MSQSTGEPAELADLLATVERTANAEPLACLEAGVPALAAARAAGDTDAELQVQYFVGFANHLVSRDDAAMVAMERALHLARTRKDRRWEARVIGGLGAVHSGFGDNASAIEYLEQSLAIRRETGDAFGIAASLNNLGVTFEEMGLFPDRARELLLEAHEMFAELGNSHGQAASLSHLASLDIARSEALAATDPQAAADVADLALVTAHAAIDHARRSDGNLRLEGETRITEARALIASNRTTEARLVLDDATAMESLVGTAHFRLGLAAARGRLHRRLGEADAAITALEAGLALGDDHVRPYERAGLLGELVEIHEERGEHALALAAHRRLLTATLDQRDDAAERRARALNARLDLERAQISAEAERLRSERLELLNRELAHHANHDALTGLVNRRGFDTALAARAALPGASLTYVLGDLDDFKAVNDDFSHQVGDEVLRRVADVVRAAVRGTDLVARIGGEEIAVLLTDPASAHRVADVCERIRREIAIHPWDEVATGLRVTISIGAASRRPDEPVAELAARADALMYEAKAAGRDRVVLAI